MCHAKSPLSNFKKNNKLHGNKYRHLSLREKGPKVLRIGGNETIHASPEK